MSPAEAWATLLILGLGTYALRASFLVRGQPEERPPAFSGLLNHAPTAALAALVTQATLAPQEGGAGVSTRLAALAVAALVAWRTRNVLLTLGAGMLALWGIRALL